MKHFLLTTLIFLLSACGGSSDDNAADNDNSPTDETSFVLHNIRFDSEDYYDGEQVTVTKGTDFEVQWVSPDTSPYRIDLYLSTNGQSHLDNNKVVGLRCGNTSFSLCPNATGQVDCRVDDDNLSCSIESDFLGSEAFQEKDLSSLRFIIRGCDSDENCDVKTFKLSVK